MLKLPALSRAAVAVANFFDASRTISTERSTLVASYGDADRVQTATSRLKAMGQARALYSNDGLAGGCVDTLARYAFPLMPRYRTGFEDVDDALDAYFRDVWAPQADANGLMNWTQMQKSWCVLRRVDGDAGVRFVRDVSGFLRLRTVEAHRIGSEDKFGDRSYSDGVRVSKDGTVISYRIQPVNRLEPLDGLINYLDSEDVPASEFMLYRFGVRPTAYRGFTGYARAVQHLHDRKDIIRYVKVAVKSVQSIPMYMLRSGGSAAGSPFDNAVSRAVSTCGDKPDVVQAKMQAGMIPVLDPAAKEDLKAIDDNRPGQNTSKFLEDLARDVAVGMGLTYEFVWNASGAAGTSMRTVLEQTAWAVGEEQDDFIAAIGNRVAAMVAVDAVVNRRLKLPRQVPLEALLRAPEWQRPPEVSIDRGQAKEDREDIATGTDTLDNVASRRGRDWLVIRKQKERETSDLLTRAKRLSEEYGVTMDTAINLLSRPTPNGLQPTPGQPTSENEAA